MTKPHSKSTHLKHIEEGATHVGRPKQPTYGSVAGPGRYVHSQHRLHLSVAWLVARAFWQT